MANRFVSNAISYHGNAGDLLNCALAVVGNCVGYKTVCHSNYLLLFIGFSRNLHCFQNLRIFRHTGDTAVFRSGKAGSGSGKPHHIGQFLMGQSCGVFILLQQLPDCAAAKDISRTGGIDYLDAA